MKKKARRLSQKDRGPDVSHHVMRNTSASVFFRLPLPPVERNRKTAFFTENRFGRGRWRFRDSSRVVRGRPRPRPEPDRVAAIARNEHPRRRTNRRCCGFLGATFFLGVRVTRANDARAPAVRRAEDHGIAARARESTTARRALEAFRRSRATRTATGPRDPRRAPRRIDSRPFRSARDGHLPSGALGE